MILRAMKKIVPLSNPSSTLIRLCACVAVAVETFGVTAFAAAQPGLSGKVSGGFQAPTSTDSQGRRNVLKGQEARPVGDNVMEITQPRVTSFNADDTPDMYIESPRCRYDMRGNSASSDSTLSVRTADGRFSIQGSGWLWQPSGSQLTISNHVSAMVEKSAVSGAMGNKSASPATNQPVRITSTFFQQEGEAVSFIENVTVLDGDDRLTCDRLNLQIVKPGGVEKIDALQNVRLKQNETEVTSGRMIYQVKEDLIQISDHPRWILSGREGTADLLALNRSNNTVFAEGNVFMKLPLTNIVTATGTNNASPQGSATARFIEITSAKFAYAGAATNRPTQDKPTAVYTGSVRVVHPEATITSDELKVLFDTQNRVSRLQAEGHVTIENGENKAFGERADYDVTGEKVTLTGQPHWALGARTGSSEQLVLLTKSSEVLALGGVKMILPGQSAGGMFAMESSATTRPPTGSDPLTISAQTFSHAENVSVFEGAVQTVDTRGTMDCRLLTIFGGESNRVQRIVAELGVTIRQPEMAAFGERADYDTRTELVRLTGHPEMITPGRTLRADAFVIDRRKNTFSVSPGNYRIEFKTEKKRKGPSNAAR